MDRLKENRHNLLDRLGGDKVIWIIALCLCMFSMVSIFSSTSLLASMNDSSRIEIAKDQLITILLGLVIMFVCFSVKKPGIYRWLSRLGFPLSLFLLLMLVVADKVNIPFIQSVERNNATRWLSIFGVTISVYEVVKVAMVMYVAWGIDHIRNDKLPFKLNDFMKDTVYLFIPTLIVTVLTFVGGGSSALFLADVLFLTMLLGGVNFKHMLILGVVGIGVLGCCFGLFKLTENSKHPMFGRVETMISRVTKTTRYYENVVINSSTKDKNYYDALDKIRQPYGAKIAIKEGGFLGKGPGQSTQKYKVAVMYEDYMFSFIVEEYGFWGVLIVFILYLSLLSRGSIIARHCSTEFASIAVAGLTALICCQALFHIIINCDVGILTGQTLPMISHGTSSFLCFCIAFGVILSLSRKTEKKVEQQADEAGPLIAEAAEEETDEI